MIGDQGVDDGLVQGGLVQGRPFQVGLVQGGLVQGGSRLLPPVGRRLLAVTVWAAMAANVVALAHGQATWQIELADGQTIAADSWCLQNEKIRIGSAAAQQAWEINAVQRVTNSQRDVGQVAAVWQIGLRDGGLLLCRDFSSRDRTLRFHLACGCPAELPLSEVRFVRRIDQRGQPLAASEWEGRLAGDLPEGDLLAVKREAGLRWIEGYVGAIDADSVEMTIADKTAPIPLDRIEGLIFESKPLLTKVSPQVTVEFWDGGRLQLAQLACDAENLLAVTLRGSTMSLPLHHVKAVDWGTHRRQWLSDLTPSTLDWQPLLASGATAPALRRFNLPRLDRSVDGLPLALEIRRREVLQEIAEIETFPRGVAMPGGSRIAFPLNGEFRKMTGILGMAPMPVRSQVRVFISGDGRELFNHVFDPQVEPWAIPINLDVSGVKRLLFVVDYHDGTSVGDLIHFCQAELWK